MTPSNAKATLAEIAAHCAQGFALPPSADDEQVFAEPWQAQAFATTVALHQQGCFSWGEWAAALSAAIARAQARGGHDDGRDYYLHWLDALEQLVQAKGLAQGQQLAALAQAWSDAAEATPHGQPIELSAERVGEAIKPSR